MADTWQPTIRTGHCDVRSAWRNHHALQFPMGYYCAAGVTGPKAIMTMILEPMKCRAGEVARVEVIVSTIPKPMGCRTYGMCGVFCFCATIPPLCCLALNVGLDLGPLVSAWV
jgi:hypothetical protein